MSTEHQQLDFALYSIRVEIYVSDEQIPCTVITQTTVSTGMDFMFANFGVLKLQNQTSLMFSNPHTNTDPLQIWRVTAILEKKKWGGRASHLFFLCCSNIRRPNYLNHENRLYFAKYQFIHRDICLDWSLGIPIAHVMLKVQINYFWFRLV